METIKLSYPPEIESFQRKDTVIALGYFDGVHKGHQQVIETAKKIAKDNGWITSVMTFDPHPKEVLRKKEINEPLTFITPLHKKIEVLSQMGIDRLYIVHFSEALSKLTPQDFVDQYLIGLNAKHIVAGFDYTYGHLGQGTMETLPFHSRGQFSQTTVQKVEFNECKISSTFIRQKITQGEVEHLPSLLGREYELEGEVIHGDKRGRTIGFPTANIQLKDRYMIPKNGVYAVSVTIENKQYYGVCNIGYRPTFKDEEKRPSIEVFLFNFDQDIYGKHVAVQFYLYLRGEKKFASVDDLIY